MALVKAPVRTTGTVPAELTDLASQVWRDEGLYDQWSARYAGRNRGGDTWAERFARGRDGWAFENGYTNGDFVDHARLIELGIPYVGRLTRSMARAEAESPDPAAFRKACRLAPYGPLAESHAGAAK